MTEHAIQPSPLIDEDILLNLPALEDAGMLGFEAMAFVRLHVPNAEYALYVSGADGKDTLFGLLNTPQNQRLGFFYLSEYEWARRVLGIPIQRDEVFTQGELREIAYFHYSAFLAHQQAS
jgi:hypothetical protein